jgi:hypothetical protein
MSHVMVKHNPPQTPLGIRAKWDSSKNEIVFARGPRGHRWNYGVQASFVVGFDEISVTGRTQAVAQLNSMADQVTGILRAAYDEYPARIHLVRARQLGAPLPEHLDAPEGNNFLT